MDRLVIQTAGLTPAQLTKEECAFLRALLSVDRYDKQAMVQNASAGRVKVSGRTISRLISEVEIIDSIAEKLAIELQR